MSHQSGCIQVLTLLLIQLPAKMCLYISEVLDDLGAWAPVSHVVAPEGVPGLWLGIASARLM